MSIIKDYFKNTTKTIISEYERSKSLNHSGNKGEVREIFIERFLKSFFPNKFIFSSGEIIDSKENINPQADVVVYNESMAILSYGDIHQFFAEGVMAHIEVKSSLDKEKLSDALNKCSAVQNLSYSLDPDMITGDLREHIPSFIVAYEGSSSETFRKNILEFVELNPEIKLPKGIFVLSQGYSFTYEDNEMTFSLTNEETLLLLFTKLNYAMWKNWTGFPGLGQYVKKLSYKRF